jgi:UDP-3-O-[3-hydroxymyristoyl] glucosamine N-acyltransferase
LAISLGELAVQFGCELIGDPQAKVSGVATLSNAGVNDLSFFANSAYRDLLRATRAAAVILRPGDAADCAVNTLLADDPYLVYARAAALLYPAPKIDAGIHASAVVSPLAKVSDTAQVAALAVIDDHAVILDGVYVGSGAVVGPRCRVGGGSRILAGVTLVQDVAIGERCIIHPGAVIGADGFGNARTLAGWQKVPQVGGVSIGNDVEVGANTTIDRGAIDDTVIEDGVRLDNLVQIAHNVRLGAHTAMAALCGVSGSTTIGKRCMFAGQVGVVGHVDICDDVVIGGASMVSKDITQPGFYAGSFPAETDREWKRKVARFRRLGNLTKRVSEIEKKVRDDGK